MAQLQVLDTVTYAKKRELAQAAVWKTLRDNIADTRVKHIDMTDSVELKRGIEFPHVLVPLPNTPGIHSRADWDVYKVKITFSIKVLSRTEKDYTELPDLIVNVLESNQSNTRSIGLSKFNHEGNADNWKWEPTMDRKLYTSIVTITYEWNGSA